MPIPAAARQWSVEVAGASVLLLADKALYWPAQQLLCIADAHFGKAAAYRALGQPVPQGTTASNLQRLHDLLAQYPTRRLVFLGDFLHAPKSHAPATLAALHDWRQRHPDLHCTLIRGNHDLRAGDPPDSLGIEHIDEPLLLFPFALQHTPIAHAGHHVIAGHTHPVFRLQGRARQSLRLPCFHLSDTVTILPSFGDFTGGHAIGHKAGERVFVTDNHGIWPIPIAQ